MLKIAHNVGHSEKNTPGKQSPDGVKEWRQADAICKLVIAELANYEGVAQKRFDDITGCVDIPLDDRWRAINDWGAHVGIDYHLNAFGTDWNDANGVEVFVAKSKPKEALELAAKMQANLVAATGFRDRGVKFEDFAMLRYTKKTHVLVEMGFMTNRQNTDFIRSAEGQKKIAAALVNSLVSQYGLKKSVSHVTSNKKSFFFTGGYQGQELASIHQFLLTNGYGYTPLRNEKGYLMFDVGGFPEGSEAEKKMEGFLQKNKFAYEKRVV